MTKIPSFCIRTVLLVASAKLAMGAEDFVSWGGPRTLTRPVVGIAAGGDATYALQDDGTVVMWGGRPFGMTGPAPSLGFGIGETKVVAANSRSVATIRRDDSLEIWGKFGYEYNKQRILRLPVLGRAIAMSDDSGVVIADSEGNVSAWTLDSMAHRVSVPASIGLSRSVAAGTGHFLALRMDGTVAAWGLEKDGQADVPSDLKDVVAIGAGGFHSLAVRKDGTVVAWGSNDHGQLDAPTELTGVVAVAAGQFHSLALKSNGLVVAWGRDSSGESTVPEGLSNVVAVAAGRRHSVALKADGSVVCWGENWNGQCHAPPPSPAGIQKLSSIFRHTLALMDDGSLRAWGGDGGAGAYGNGSEATLALGLDSIPKELKNLRFKDIAAGTNQNLALTTDGQIKSWGGFYRFMSGDLIGRGLPEEVSDSRYLGIAAAPSYNLALREDSTLFCWCTFNADGLAPGRDTTYLQSLRGIGSIVAGGKITIALKPDGTAFVASGTPWSPQFDTIPGVVTAVAGYNQAILLMKDGRVKPMAAYPYVVDSFANQLTDVVQISGGYFYYYLRYRSPGNDFILAEHFAALKKDGTVVSWGSPGCGYEVVPPGLSGVSRILSNGQYSIAIKDPTSSVRPASSLGRGPRTPGIYLVVVRGLDGRVQKEGAARWTGSCWVANWLRPGVWLVSVSTEQRQSPEIGIFAR